MIADLPVRGNKPLRSTEALAAGHGVHARAAWVAVLLIYHCSLLKNESSFAFCREFG